MTSSAPDEMDEDILTQAADWCMRLHDDHCPSDDRREFQDWIQLDPRHAFEYAKMLEIWDLSGQLPDEPETAKKLLTGDASMHKGSREM
ncbi:FecR/PupR family sigma factor regulator [Pseudomonas neuropathica]|jgi:transmembrane sensor